jgi:O-antigen/teichoic acid export membrane protein
LFQLLGIGLFIGIAGMAAAYLGGEALLRLLYTSEYAEFSNVFFWLMFAALVAHIGSFLNYSLTAQRYLKVQPTLLVVALLVAFGLCFILIPRYGLLGAVWAYTGSLAVRLIVTAVWNVFGLRRMSTGKLEDS